MSEVGSFQWAKEQLDKQQAAREAAQVEYGAKLAAERELEERKADPANLTHEEAIAEIKLLRERVNELETQLSELEDWKRGIERAVSGNSGDW